MNTIQTRDITGFECETKIENVLFHTTLTAEAFLPNPTFSAVAHNHPLFEGHLFLSPSAVIVTPVGMFRAEKNDFCLFPPRLYHSAKADEDPAFSIAFSFSFSRIEDSKEADLYSALCELIGDMKEPLIFRRAFSIGNRLFELTEEMGHGLVGKTERLRIKTAQVLFALVDLLKIQLRGEYSGNLSHSTKQRLAIDLFFAKNHTRDVTVKELADVIFLSERQTNRVLEELYGISFKQKLIETRIGVAMQALISTDLPILEIAERSGYRSSVGFHTAFRQITGSTPLKWRNQMRKKSK